MKIKFKNRDVPEGVARLIDELNKRIYPQNVPAEPEKSDEAE